MNRKNSMKGVVPAAVLVAFLVLLGSFSVYLQYYLNQPQQIAMARFDTCSDLVDAFNESRSRGYYPEWGLMETLGTAVPMAATSDAGAAKTARDYSTTNIQVEGVDEADIVKSDGTYIYTVTSNKLVIMRAYPPERAEVLSETELGDFTPSEMFIHGDNLMLFGSTQHSIEPVPLEKEPSGIAVEEMIAPYPYWRSMTTVQLWDISDREEPERVRELDFEGSYLTSRKIGDDVYFVINSYPQVYALPENPVEILPVYRDRSALEIASPQEEEFKPVCGCVDVAYFEPIYAERFITIASISITDPDAEVNKETIVGSGQNVYASQKNLYVAETNQNYWNWDFRESGAIGDRPTQSTIVHKFALNNGDIVYTANAEVPGWVLNQFSMDEYEEHFRIATTVGHVTQRGSVTSNNVYIYNKGMNLTGKLEDLAPGEQIYSARFMGERGYLVTFKKIDPLFVIDLSDPSNPRLLGKLKIPGYSDYLHPYDENHIIGIGKETVEAEAPGRDFSWYQGVKMALFDVSDVENPIELHKVIIGDRGTDSDVLHDHKAFLFDRERNLLVIPILLAELKGEPEELDPWSHGEYVYQGAYVYRLTLDDGFELRGRITHYDDDDAFQKAGYYFRGDYSVIRSMYIEDILYTLSGYRLKANALSDLDELAVLDFGEPDKNKYPYYDWA